MPQKDKFSKNSSYDSLIAEETLAVKLFLNQKCN
jgi:hypothetical protein